MKSTYVDTNVLVRTVDIYQPDKRERALALLEEETRTGPPTISATVLGELYFALVRPVRIEGVKHPPLCASHGAAASIVLEAARHFTVVDVTQSEIVEAIRLRGRYQLGWWDAVHLAAARAANCTRLLTEDVGSAPSIEGVVYVNPFADLNAKPNR